MRNPKATSSSSSSSSSKPKTLSHLPSHYHDEEHRDGDSKLSIRRRSRWIPAAFERKRWRVRDIVTAGLVVSILLYAANVSLLTRYVDGKRCEYIYLRHVVEEYYNPNDCFSRADIQQILLGLVWALADTFEHNDIPYWLDSGTLLGAYREKTVIPHDYDADVGIDEATYFKLRDTDLKLDFPSVYELQVFEAKYRKHGNRDVGIPSRLVHTKSGMYVDIFVFLESRTPKTDPQPMFGPIPSSCFTYCVHCPKLAHGGYEFKIPKNWVFPLKQCMFGGRFVNCPAQPEKYLEHLYGSSYMTPDQ